MAVGQVLRRYSLVCDKPLDKDLDGAGFGFIPMVQRLEDVG